MFESLSLRSMDTDTDTDTDTDVDTGHSDFKQMGTWIQEDTVIKYVFINFYLLSRLIFHPQTIILTKTNSNFIFLEKQKSTFKLKLPIYIFFVDNLLSI